MVSRKIKPHISGAPQPRHELLHVADVVAREKNLEREEVLFAMEQAILKVAKSKYGEDHDIRVEVDRSSGEVFISRAKIVSEVVYNPLMEISLPEAKIMDPSSAIGDEILEELPPVDFGRVTAQSARQVIFQKVKEAERTHIYEEYKDRVGEVISALVRRVEFGNVYLDLDRGEALLRKEDMIPRENFRVGDRIRVIITEIRPEARGPMILTSRTHPHFMAHLFEQEVPEIYDGLIQIKGVARDPGSRAKMAVSTADPLLDAVGSCVGIRGSRVQSIINEFGGEKVDIIPWSENPATYVVNALAPAEVIRVVLEEETSRVLVVVPESQLSLAIGRRGQNVRLASQLTGWHIDIITEAEDTARREEDFAKRTALFMEALDVDETFAQLLALEGFIDVEELSQTTPEDFASIEGLDADIGAELARRAAVFLTERLTKLTAACKALGADDTLLTFEGLSLEVIHKLCQSGVLTLDDFADLSGDEALEMIGSGAVSLSEINGLIMKAREKWFQEEKNAE